MGAQFDLVIRNALVFDGTGAPPLAADVAVNDDRIARVGFVPERGGREIDVAGLALAPGFIDVHSHDDYVVLTDPEMDFKVMQGVTTDVVGNCGAGIAPGAMAARVFARMINPRTSLPRWNTYGEYMRLIDSEPASLNVAVLAGHGTIRLSIMGSSKRPPDSEEMRQMCGIMHDALGSGVVGLSTGLAYDPGRYASSEEILRIVHEMRGTTALYASHMRDEGPNLLDSIAETIRVGADTGVAVQISHHKAIGRDNWGMVKESLRLIDEARRDGLDVTADQYPYCSAGTILYALVQNSVFDPDAPEGAMGRAEPKQILIASTLYHPEREGKTLQAVADEIGLPAAEAAAKILKEDPGTIVILESLSEEDVTTVMRHPSTMIGSDGIAAGGKPHPRLYGTFPRVLGRYVRDLGIVKLEEAIRRMTSMPAEKFKLEDRGTIRPDAFADIVIFDPERIAACATYADPRRYPAGIRDVFVNGTAVVRDGCHARARPGRALRRFA